MSASGGAAATDGRRARGEAKRRALIDAALAVIARDGTAGLTHRAVAAEAGVSLSAVSYHYAGIDDLVRSALEVCTEDLLAELPAGDGRTPRALARYLHRYVSLERSRLIAEYELYLLAIRNPELRAVSVAWLDHLADAYVPEATAPQRRAFRAVVEGICLHALVEPTPPSARTIEATLLAAWPGGAGSAGA